jgi:hypothetical protein
MYCCTTTNMRLGECVYQAQQFLLPKKYTTMPLHHHSMQLAHRATLGNRLAATNQPHTLHKYSLFPRCWVECNITYYSMLSRAFLEHLHIPWHWGQSHSPCEYCVQQRNNTVKYLMQCLHSLFMFPLCQCFCVYLNIAY